MKEQNPTIRAINNYNELYEKILKNLVKQEKPTALEISLRARAREFPLFICEVGLINGLSFCFAKCKEGEKKLYSKLIEYLNEPKEETLEKLAKDEGAGYSSYLYLILKEIKDMKIIDDVDEKSPYNFIQNLAKNLEKASIITSMLIPYMIELKRLCEATLRGGE